MATSYSAAETRVPNSNLHVLAVDRCKWTESQPRRPTPEEQETDAVIFQIGYSGNGE